MKKRLLSLLLAVVMVVTLLPFSAFAEEVASGTCGENATWVLDENGKLTISGTGPMNDGLGPWHVSDGPRDSSVKEIYIEDGITSIGAEAFFGQNELKSVRIPDSVTSIGDSAFYNCTSIESVEIPDSVTSIGNSAFFGCESLTSVTISESVTSIGANAFGECTSLASIEIPGSVKKFNESAFAGCENLTSVTINEGVRSIPRDAFGGCKNLESITIPSTVTLIGNYVFNDCDKLKDVYYTGNKADWKNISCGVDGNDPLLLDAVIHYSESEHNWGEWTVSKDPTCAEEGEETRICTTCDKVETREIAVIDHDYGEWEVTTEPTCTEKGEETRGCSHCDATETREIAVIDHDYGEWEVTTEPTCTEKGEETRGCSHCDATETREIAALGHDYIDGVCTRCGDAEEAVAIAAPEITVSNNTTSGKPKISWGAVDGAEKYYVYRSTSKNGTYKKLSTTTKTSITNKSAKAGTKYFYKVRAVADDGTLSDFSAIKSITCDCAKPVVKATNTASTGRNKLSWSAIDGATKYYVYRSTSKSGTYSKIGTATGTSYTDTTAKAGKMYYYKVKAICANTNGNSAFSAIVSRTCDCARPNVTVKLSSGHPQLSWAKITGASKYAVYRSTSKSGDYSKIGSTTSVSYTDKTAKAGKTYYYKVKAINTKSAANSAYSLVDSIKAK